MNEIIAGLRLADLIDGVIVLTVVEGLLISLYHRRSGRGVAPREFAINLVSGLCLMLALRAAVASAGWAWIAALLLASGTAHALDLWRRWQG